MKTIFLISLLLLCSCRYEEEEKKPPPVLKVRPLNSLPDLADLEVVFEEEIVNNDTFVSLVEAGDKVFVAMEGFRETPLFSKVYEEESWASWEKDVGCENARGFCSSEPYVLQGKCRAGFRDYEGVQTEKIRWKGNAEIDKVKIRIGTKEYPLGTTSNPGEPPTFVFDVTEEMVRESDELYLVVVKNPTKRVRVGLVNYTDCNTVGMLGTGHDVDFKMMPAEAREHYIVNLWIKSKPNKGR